MLPSRTSSTLPTATLNQSDSTYPPISTPTHGAQAWPSWVLPHPLNVLPCPCATSGHLVPIQQHPVSSSIPETKLPLSLEILYGCQGQTPSPRSVFDSPDQVSSLRPSICTQVARVPSEDLLQAGRSCPSLQSLVCTALHFY